MYKELKSLNFDFEKRAFLLNGEDVSKNICRFNLHFDNGIWELEICEKKTFDIYGKSISKI